MPISQEVLNEINHFVDLTNKGKIIWNSVPNNVNAFKWERNVDNKNYHISIQIQNLGNLTAEFCFLTIVKVSPPPAEALLQINTQIDIEYKAILKNLFIAASGSAKNALSTILSNLTKGL